jgi:hypothetical protein
LEYDLSEALGSSDFHLALSITEALLNQTKADRDRCDLLSKKLYYLEQLPYGDQT